ncbi:MAG: PAS domain-containing sensor histidine kinase [Chitinophagaceae bacterium]|nr:MAG: PAS domain-containing sensor histidine kinase [Chitinophagaceae bacterium]
MAAYSLWGTGGLAAIYHYSTYCSAGFIANIMIRENETYTSGEELDRLRAENRALSKQLQQLTSITMANADVAYKMTPDWTHLLELTSSGFLAPTEAPDAGWMERYLLPEDRPMVALEIARAIAEKRMYELEHRVRTLDGKEGWALSRAIPVLDADGNIEEWLGLAINITARKQAEHNLLQAKEDAETQKRQYETITGNTPDLVYVFDLDANFSYANTALLNMWGRTKENSFGKSLLEVGYEPWHAEMHIAEINHIKKTKETVRGEVAFPHATLGKRVYDYILVPVLDAHGEVKAIAGTTRDITEIRKLSEQKDEFLAIASHELKTPLTSLKAYGQVLQNIFESREDEEAVVLLDRMDKQINKLTGLITDLLDVTRIQAGKMEFNQEHFNLAGLAADILDELQLTTTRHRILKELPENLPFFGDRERVGQVITNLVTNAIKYSPEGGKIEVALKTESDHLLLSVKDEGIGIPEGMHGKVFEQFYRANNYRQAISGMGIGLYISAEIVHRSGGKIWVESNEGDGSTFYVSMPLGSTH